jgi:Putative beta-barrel porin-2, OmpL-like. bbp2
MPPARQILLAALAGVALAVLPSRADAQQPVPAPAPPAPAPATPPPPVPVPAPPAPPPPAPASPLASALSKATYNLNAYVEMAYTYSIQNPSNGIINERAFDDRHNTFTVQNAVLDASGSIVGLSARVALQVGHTPDTYYLSEPSLPGTSSVGASSASSWKYIQQAYGGYRIDRAGLTLEGGIFLSPIGPEAMAAKDDWNYSRSNLFFGLPFYHTGIRATLEATANTTLALWLVNGWNNVVDNNSGKSVLAEYTYKIPDRLLFNLIYMTGIERNRDAPEGQPWRHLIDVNAQFDVTKWLSFISQVDVGFEPNNFGLSDWGAAAVYGRVHPTSWLYVAARGDVFVEHRGSGPTGTASPVFFPARWVGSGTLTLDGRPHDNVSLRLEYRHDQAASDIYFAGPVRGNGDTTPYVPNSRAQDTITAAALAWF